MDRPASLDDLTGRVLRAYCAAAGVDPTLVEVAGITVAGEESRAGTRIVSAYELGHHLVLRCDPAVVDRCRELLGSEGPPTLEHFESTLPAGTDMLGRGLVHVLPPRSSWPDATGIRRLDPRSARDRALIGDLAAADPEGADMAEIDLDALDDEPLGVEIDERLVAFASERPWEEDPEVGDIGVLTHPGHRGRGWAVALVTEVSRRIVAHGRVPMYRNNLVNVASKGVADRVGFREITRLSAGILPPD